MIPSLLNVINKMFKEAKKGQGEGGWVAVLSVIFLKVINAFEE